jgi:hypothetical protein
MLDPFLVIYSWARRLYRFPGEDVSYSVVAPAF